MKLPVYVHVPFCRSKCPYCAFTSKPLAISPGLGYMAALLTELTKRLGGLDFDPETPSVYFGGGTPSLLAPDQVSHILTGISRAVSLDQDAEITIEANPGTVDRENMSRYREAGVNRVSIGCQSFDDALLGHLGRIHTAEQAISAYDDARAAGFDNVSIDLMFGIPGQTRDLWRETLRIVVELAPEHISLYCLTIEPQTPFAVRHSHGDLFPSDSADQREEREADMFEAAMETLSASGYEHYEIANFARPNRRSRHNLAYWRNEPYIGCGPAAHSYLPTDAPPLCERSANTSDIDAYIDLARRRGVAVSSRERLSAAKSLGESIMLGLRMIEGVDLQQIADRWGLDPRELFAAQIANLTSKGLIELEGSILRLSHRGILLADEAMQLFV